MSELLVSHIEEGLPSMFDEVQDKLAKAEAELAELPDEPPTETHTCRAEAISASREVVRVLRRVTEFVDAAGAAGVERSSAPCVVQIENRARKMFQEAVLKTRPGFGGEKDRIDLEVTKVQSPGSCELNFGVRLRTVGERVTSQALETPRSVTEVGDLIAVSYSTSGYTQGKVIRVSPYFRGDLAARIEQGRGRELPGFLNFHVFTLLVGEYVALWKAPTEYFQQTLHDALAEAADKVVDEHAGSRSPQLARKLKSELNAYVAARSAEAKERLKGLLEQEMRPCTENHYLWDTINKIRNQRIEDKINSIATKPGKIVESPYEKMRKWLLTFIQLFCRGVRVRAQERRDCDAKVRRGQCQQRVAGGAGYDRHSLCLLEAGSQALHRLGCNDPHRHLHRAQAC